MFPTQFTGASFTWERKKLGILTTRVRSYSFSRSVEVKEETGVKYVHYGDIHTSVANEIGKNNNLPFINETYKESDELKLDDVIVADASEDYKGIADAAVIISNLPYTIIAGLHTIALRPTSLIKGYFLYHIFKTENFKRFGYKIGTGLKVFGISYNNLAKYKVYYPQEIEEQEKIIGILSNLTNSINLHERKCEELTLIKKALLQKLFPKKEEVRPEVRYKNFSDAWEQRKLGEVADVIDPHPSHRAPAEVKIGIPFIGISDVNEIGEINYSTVRVVDEDIYEEHHRRYDLSIPSLGIGRVASLGKVIRLRNDIGKYAISPTMSVLQPDTRIEINYLYSYMNSSQFQKQFSAKSNGSTRQSVGIKDLRTLVVSVPSSSNEQQKIGEYFSKFDSLIALHQRKLEKLKQLKKFLLQNMFI